MNGLQQALVNHVVRIPLSTHAEHLRECVRHDWARDHATSTGAIRRCPHGKVQQLTHPHPDSKVQGTGVRWWRDLHRVWDWRMYRLAKRLLDAQEATR